MMVSAKTWCFSSMHHRISKMADIFFDDVDSLLDAVESGISDVLLNDVAPVVEDILLKHIKSDIYEVYTPKPGAWVNGTTYQRRHVLEDGITSMIDGGNTLVVTSDATANQSVVKGYHFSNRYAGSFLQLLESGHMGIWKNGFARPAVANAQREAENSSKVAGAVKRGRVMG